MFAGSINLGVSGLAEPPKKTDYSKIILEAFKDAAPMLACSFVCLAADFIASTLIFRNLDSDARYISSIFNSMIEWPMAAFSVGLTTTTSKLAKTAAEYEQEYLHHSHEGVEHPNRNWGKLGSHLQHAFIAALIYAAVFGSLLLFATGSFVKQMGCEERAIPGVIRYAKAYAIGTLPCYFLQYLGNQFNYAMRQRLPVLIIQAIAGGTGIGCGYALMQNFEGDDTDKLMGMAYGFSIRYIVAALGHAIYIACTQHKQRSPGTNISFNIELFKWQGFDKKYFLDIMGNGLLTQGFIGVEVGMIPTMALLASLCNDPVLKRIIVQAIQIAVQFISLLIVFLITLGDVASIQISAALGRGEPQNVARIAGTLTAIGIATQVAFLILFLIIPNTMIGIFINSSPENEDVDLIVKMSYTAIIGMCVGQGFDAPRLILGGGLRGMQDFVVSFIASIAFLLPVTYGVGRLLSDYGIVGDVAARDLAIFLSFMLVTLWFKYKSQNPEETISTVISHSRLFRCCKPSPETEEENYFENESTSLLDHHTQAIERDPDVLTRYGNPHPNSQFKAPNVISVFH